MRRVHEHSTVIARAFSTSVDGVCITPSDYSRTAIPAWITNQARRVILHQGLFSENKLLAEIPGVLSRIELNRPHPNLQERFFSIGGDALISNVIGQTRALHNLMLLRLLGIRQQRITLHCEHWGLSAEYQRILKSMCHARVMDRAVFCFDIDAMVLAWRRASEHAFVHARWNGHLLRCVLVRDAERSTLVVHITPVYGSQLTQFVDVLASHFGLKEVFLFGACGAVSPYIRLHDTVFPETVLDDDGNAIVSGNLLLEHKAEYPKGLTGCGESHVANVASAPCIPAETRSYLERLASRGASVVDLEMGPLATYLRKTPSLRWGAALHVSDRPLQPAEQLGTQPILDSQSAARQNEIAARVKMMASRRSTAARRTADNINWICVSGEHIVPVRETVLTNRDGQEITVHATELKLDRLDLDVVVNADAQGQRWEDAVVRGTQPWGRQHMAEMERLFRRSPAEYLRELSDPSAVIALLNGNGNLFWNLGHFVICRGTHFHHFRERPVGCQTMLIANDQSIKIDTVNMAELGSDTRFAVSGCRILRDSDPVDLVATDPQTNRPPLADFYGDMTHVLHGFRLSLALSRLVFFQVSQRRRMGEHEIYERARTLSPLIVDAVCGHPITCVLDSDDPIDDIRTRMEEFGYLEHGGDERLTPGSYFLHDQHLLAIAFRRATLGHSIIASTRDEKTLLVVNTYTDATRKGFTLEDTARLVRRVGWSLGHEVVDAMILASSGDPRILLCEGERWRCLEKNARNQTLLFKGGLDYGLTSFIAVSERR